MLQLFRWIGCGNVFVSVLGVPPSGTAIPMRRVKIYGHVDTDIDTCLRMYEASASHPDQSPFVWGSVDCGSWTTPTAWCLVIVRTERWSFDGTIFPKLANPDLLRTHPMDCVGMRSLLDALHSIFVRPIATLSVSEDVERNNIVHEYTVRLDALRWMHVLCMANMAAGARWHQLVTSGEPTARATRIHTLHRTRCVKHRSHTTFYILLAFDTPLLFGKVTGCTP